MSRSPELEALIDAAELDQDEARRLLEKKPELIRERGSLGETALHFLVIEGFSQGAAFLLEMGADINTQDQFGSTPLAHAVLLGNEKMVDLLLAGGADVSIKDDETDSPMHLAARRGEVEIFAALVRAGADPTYRTDLEEAAIDAAPIKLRDRFAEIIRAGRVS